MFQNNCLLEQFPRRELHLNKAHGSMDILWDLEVLLVWRVSNFSVGGDTGISGTSHHSLFYVGRSSHMWATAVLQQAFSKSSTSRVQDKAGLAHRWATDCAELLSLNICTWSVSGAQGWKLLSLTSAINFSSADIMVYICNGRRLYLAIQQLQSCTSGCSRFA